MKYKIEFQYKPEGTSRPYDECQDLDISSDLAGSVPIPDVGDTVYVGMGQNGQNQDFKVLTRHFIYSPGLCAVCIVITDVDANEMAARLKC